MALYKFRIIIIIINVDEKEILYCFPDISVKRHGVPRALQLQSPKYTNLPYSTFCIVYRVMDSRRNLRLVEIDCRMQWRETKRMSAGYQILGVYKRQMRLGAKRQVRRCNRK